MQKPSTYLVIAYFLTYLPIWVLFPTELLIKVKPNINSDEVHPELSTIGHPVDGGLVALIWSHILRIDQEVLK
jgi:hypothetical protein